jgi:hypothetical protein
LLTFVRECVLQRIQYEFRDDQAEARRLAGGDTASIGRHFERGGAVVPDHRAPDALAQLRQIRRHFDGCDAACNMEVSLDGRHRHDPTVSVLWLRSQKPVKAIPSALRPDCRGTATLGHS